jgi:hypothetical protein
LLLRRSIVSEQQDDLSGAEAQELSYFALNLRVRFDPPELETHALREKDNIIELLQRAGYDAEPMGLQVARR